MATETMRRCKCGDPLNFKGLCYHCDTGQCNTEHKGITEKDVDGPHCQPKHDWDTCPRCRVLDAWLPQPGDFTDLPDGYQNNTGRR